MDKMNTIFRNISVIAVLLLTAAAGIVSCSKDTKGAGDIRIGFSQETYRFKEGAGLNKIQLEITGEAVTYPVTFDVEARIISEEAVDVNDVIHFTQTEGLKIKGKDLAPVFLEFTVKDNDVINETRKVELTITNVKGAEISTGKTVLEIRDNDNNPYDKLMGDWTASATDYNGDKVTFPVNISGGFTESDINNNEGHVLVCWGFGSYQREFPTSSPTKQPVWYMDFDEDAHALYVQTNTLMANVFQFSDISYDVIIRCCTVLPGNSLSLLTPLEGSWSSDMNTITFQSGGYGLTAAIFTTDGEYTDSVWMIFTDIVLTRDK